MIAPAEQPLPSRTQRGAGRRPAHTTSIVPPSPVAAQGRCPLRSCASRLAGVSCRPYAGIGKLESRPQLNPHAVAACLNTGELVLIVLGTASTAPLRSSTALYARLDRGGGCRVGSGKPETPWRRMHSDI